MRKIISFILCSFLYEIVNCYTTYDQRQTGGINIQVDVKDIRLFAFTKGNKEEYIDYDYAYDYSEMTIKPQPGSKPKPNVTSTVATTSVTSVANVTNFVPGIEHTSEISLQTEKNVTENNSTSNSTLQSSLSHINGSLVN